jgi:hypothetical protein
LKFCDIAFEDSEQILGSAKTDVKLMFSNPHLVEDFVSNKEIPLQRAFSIMKFFLQRAFQ